MESNTDMSQMKTEIVLQDPEKEQADNFEIIKLSSVKIGQNNDIFNANSNRSFAKTEPVKTITIISLKPNGDIKLKNVDMIWTSSGLEIPIKGNSRFSQGPEFIQSPYTYCLNYSGHNKEKNIHIHSNIILDVECGCGHSEHNNNFRGTFYLVKHDPLLRQRHKFDFTKKVTYDEFQKYDTAINCTENDIDFIRKEINERYTQAAREYKPLYREISKTPFLML